MTQLTSHVHKINTRTKAAIMLKIFAINNLRLYVLTSSSKVASIWSKKEASRFLSLDDRHKYA